MESSFVAIKNAVISLLKRLDPNVDVFFEKMPATDEEHGLQEPQTYYFLELIPNINETVDKCFTDRVVLIDIAYHEKEESNTKYLIKAAELDAIIRPVFCFGDRNITIPATNQKVIDHVLHTSFSVSFREITGVQIDGEKMEEIDFTVKEGV